MKLSQVAVSDNGQHVFGVGVNGGVWYREWLGFDSYPGWGVADVDWTDL